MKVKQAIKEYLVEAEIKRFTSKTVRSYRYKLFQFESFLEDEGIKDLDDITNSTLKLYLQWLTRRGLKGTTVNNYMKIVKLFLQFCYDEEFSDFNPKRSTVKMVKEEKPLVRAFTVQDVRMLLQNCKGLDYLSVRDRLIITILADTGLRATELCELKQTDIHDGYIIVKGKGQKTRSVPVTPMMKQAMMRYDRVKLDYFTRTGAKTEDYYILSKNGNLLGSTDLARMLKRRGKDITGVRVSSHTMRHFFAQQSIKNGVSLYSVSRLLGHENVGITQIYLDSLQDADIVKMNSSNSVLMNMSL